MGEYVWLPSKVLAGVHMCLWVWVGVHVPTRTLMILEDGEGIWEDAMCMLSPGTTAE